MSKVDPGSEAGAPAGGSGVSNGVKGDITVDGDVWTLNAEVVDIANLTATAVAALNEAYDASGASAAAIATHEAAGDPHPGYLLETAVSAFGATLIDDADAATARDTLGLGTAATSASTAFQAADATLTAVAGLSTSANQYIKATGADTFAMASISVAAQSLIASFGGILDLGNGGTGGGDADEAKQNLKIDRVLSATAMSEVASSTAETTILDVAIPKNTLGTYGFATIEIMGHILNNTGGTVNYTPRLYWDGAALCGDAYGITTSATNYPIRMWAKIANLGATNAQFGELGFVRGFASASGSGIGNIGQADIVSTANSGTASLTSDTVSSAVQFKVTLQMGTNNANARFHVTHAVCRLQPY